MVSEMVLGNLRFCRYQIMQPAAIPRCCVKALHQRHVVPVPVPVLLATAAVGNGCLPRYLKNEEVGVLSSGMHPTVLVL